MKNAYTHAYCFHPQTGVFTGIEFAQESPLEAGVYLLPAGATLVKPPQAPLGKHAVWRGDVWEVQDTPVIEPAPEEASTEMKPLPPTPPVELPTPEWILDLENLPSLPEPPPLTWDTIRLDRNSRIFISDWTQLADAPLTQEQKNAWAAYRQALRDVPTSFATPEEVVWPTVPV